MRHKSFFVIAVFWMAAALWAKDFWQTKPASQWTKKETEKMLNDSPWGETFTFTDQTQGYYEPTSSRNTPPGDQRENMEIYRYFRVRFLTAKPIRMAFTRMTQLLQEGSRAEGIGDNAEGFINADFGDRIILSLDADSNSGRYRGDMFQLLRTLNLGLLQQNTYLQRQDGLKNYLTDYIAPTQDGLGAKLVFPRTVNGQPFISGEKGTVRFVSQLSEQYRLNIPFRLEKMTYDGKLEY